MDRGVAQLLARTACARQLQTRLRSFPMDMSVREVMASIPEHETVPGQVYGLTDRGRVAAIFSLERLRFQSMICNVDEIFDGNPDLPVVDWPETAVRDIGDRSRILVDEMPPPLPPDTDLFSMIHAFARTDARTLAVGTRDEITGVVTFGRASFCSLAQLTYLALILELERAALRFLWFRPQWFFDYLGSERKRRAVKHLRANRPKLEKEFHSTVNEWLDYGYDDDQSDAFGDNSLGGNESEEAGLSDDERDSIRMAVAQLLLQFTMLGDKKRLLMKAPSDLRTSKRQLHRTFETAEKLRNAFAHPLAPQTDDVWSLRYSDYSYVAGEMGLPHISMSMQSQLDIHPQDVHSWIRDARALVDELDERADALSAF